jgi:hypothetical protein
MSRLSRQCVIINFSEPYRLPRSVTGMALFISLLCLLVSTVTSLLPLLGSGFQQLAFPFLWIPIDSVLIEYIVTLLHGNRCGANIPVSEPLLTNGYCIVTYFVVVACQQVYMPHYNPSVCDAFRRHCSQ